MAAALISCLPATGSAQGLVTFTAGFRGRSAFNVGAGPLFSLDVKPVRWGWGALGVELSWAPRMTQTDSGSYFPDAPIECGDPLGNTTPCASYRQGFGEATTQIGVTVIVGPRHRRTAPFGELAVGYYGTNSKDQWDTWDPTGIHLSNEALYGQHNGIYTRVGLGVQMKLWSAGPALTVSARYRWAQLGGLLAEYRSNRSGGELVVGVKF